MKLRIVAALALSLSLAGCKTAGVTGQPTAPDLNTPYQKAGTAMSSFASDVLSAQQIIINLHRGGVIDKATDTSIQQQLKQVAAYGKQIDALILAQASATTIKAKVDATLSALTAITAQTGKVDPQTLLQIQTCIGPIEQLLGTVLSAFNLTISEVTIHGSIDNRSIGRAGSRARLTALQPDQSSQDSWRCVAASVGDHRRGRRQVRSDRGDRGWRDRSAVAAV
jgi:hypothetical protein